MFVIPAEAGTQWRPVRPRWGRLRHSAESGLCAEVGDGRYWTN